MTPRDRAGDAPGQPAGQRAGQRVGQRAGRREAAGPAGHRQGFPTPAPIRPLPVRLPDRNGEIRLTRPREPNRSTKPENTPR